VEWAQDYNLVDEYVTVVTPETGLLGVGPLMAMIMFRTNALMQIAVYDVNLGLITFRDSGIKLNIISMGMQTLLGYPNVD
jgi:hypothetical protein